METMRSTFYNVVRTAFGRTSAIHAAIGRHNDEMASYTSIPGDEMYGMSSTAGINTRKLTDTWQFHVAISAVILSNTTVVGFEAAFIQEPFLEVPFRILDTGFTLIYAGEIYLRWRDAGSFKNLYTNNKQKCLHIFDVCITAGCIFDTVLCWKTAWQGNNSSGSLFGPLRLIRVTRGFRAIGFVLELDKVMTSAAISTFKFGIMVFIVLFAFAVTVTYLLWDSPYPSIAAMYRNLGCSMWSMFQLMTMDGWIRTAEAVIEKYPSMIFFYCSFIFIAGLSLISVVPAIFIELHMSAQKANDIYRQEAKQKRERQQIENMVEQLFETVDADNSGQVSLDELAMALRDEGTMHELRTHLDGIGITEDRDVHDFKLALYELWEETVLKVAQDTTIQIGPSTFVEGVVSNREASLQTLWRCMISIRMQLRMFTDTLQGNVEVLHAQVMNFNVPPARKSTMPGKKESACGNMRRTAQFFSTSNTASFGGAPHETCSNSDSDSVDFRSKGGNKTSETCQLGAQETTVSGELTVALLQALQKHQTEVAEMKKTMADLAKNLKQQIKNDQRLDGKSESNPTDSSSLSSNDAAWRDLNEASRAAFQIHHTEVCKARAAVETVRQIAKDCTKTMNEEISAVHAQLAGLRQAVSSITDGIGGASARPSVSTMLASPFPAAAAGLTGEPRRREYYEGNVSSFEEAGLPPRTLEQLKQDFSGYSLSALFPAGSPTSPTGEFLQNVSGAATLEMQPDTSKVASAPSWPTFLSNFEDQPVPESCFNQPVTFSRPTSGTRTVSLPPTKTEPFHTSLDRPCATGKLKFPRLRPPLVTSFSSESDKEGKSSNKPSWWRQPAAVVGHPHRTSPVHGQAILRSNDAAPATVSGFTDHLGGLGLWDSRRSEAIGHDATGSWDPQAAQSSRSTGLGFVSNSALSTDRGREGTFPQRLIWEIPGVTPT